MVNIYPCIYTIQYTNKEYTPQKLKKLTYDIYMKCSISNDFSGFIAFNHFDLNYLIELQNYDLVKFIITGHQIDARLLNQFVNRIVLVGNSDHIIFRLCQGCDVKKSSPFFVYRTKREMDRIRFLSISFTCLLFGDGDLLVSFLTILVIKY